VVRHQIDVYSIGADGRLVARVLNKG